ncbi:biotin--[acetyl-CoA-carboxylase] ligase [Pediococcus siamensis]|uniref:biotin--[acetyl-CoA-carboxylase] ligase n=1 Tax=Pediococcus siamensis TaxID=381829 RepID=UPI0039A27C25
MLRIKLDVKLIQQNLDQAHISAQFHYYEQLDSTNLQAKRTAQQAVPLTQAHVFVANQQTNGYGRLNRDFYSPQDTGLYISFLIPMKTGIQFHPGLLTTMTAVASLETIEAYFPVKLQIKWVNDLILDQHKVGGILAEAVTDPVSNQLKAIVIGIGVNLATKIFPKELEDIAISLSDQSHEPPQTEFVSAFIQHFFERLKTYSTGDFMPVYRKRSSVIGHHVEVQYQNQTVTGQVLDVNDEGALVLRTAKTILQVTSGEIIRVRTV